ncbi:flagellar hook assembly protein FlgD [Polynucleobacter sp. UK-Mo-2m-Kol15]|uniref:flagellar hook assembly protein FlgD n=1 Tax=Polynucleobacter sp. UK-Mo-2m-Kol15 TaxID=2576916 RepID=UPI001C0DB559|nr:flagellar hook assembly protein FlgD [Polynucleobacter sp. UK-Mo-2m-Kol15]MBU3575918.1 flagellar hook assembly protein FlgD [Polynucleobacter sp. UK-Mo-2m-Kol15]
MTTTVSNLNQTSNVGAAANAAVASSGKKIQDQFMTMLVAQIKYQDPTNPMDSSQMTSQLAQISTVDGINQLNSSMAEMSKTLQSGQTYQASSLIGKSVLAPGKAFNLVNGDSAFAVQLPTAASSVMVSIRNAAGQTVDSMNLGTQGAGVIPLTWNGKDQTGKALPDGAYTLQVAANTGGKSVNGVGLTYAKVNAVGNDPKSGATQLVLGNGTTTSLSSVVQIQ